VISRDEWSSFLGILRGRDAFEFDTLIWWQNNKYRFPTLYQIARRFLIVPATSASCERQFSKAKRLKPKKRWSLKPAKLSAMIVAAQNRDLVEEIISHRNLGPANIVQAVQASSWETDHSQAWSEIKQCYLIFDSQICL
jgi:hypothetical protein